MAEQFPEAGQCGAAGGPIRPSTSAAPEAVGQALSARSSYSRGNTSSESPPMSHSAATAAVLT
ncbi:hypothetical protein [Streptomyces davaonensis]|uniref:hypothetical protein n=1 Tax=Streptomyces davaonensis TaxID=348043 RepID=UPI001E48D902|nr:hypothetical protein [Streptomyces davaonensis]